MRYPTIYRISIRGHLDTSWSGHLGGMVIIVSGGKNTEETTVLAGELTDLAVPIGVLNTLYDLQMLLISEECPDCTNNEKEGVST